MRELVPITIDEICTMAPSVAATQPFEKASDKYSFVSTIDAIELIQSAGWNPYKVQESYVRRKDKKGFQRHVIRFTMGEWLSDLNEEQFDLVMMNSHDTGSSFKLMMGIFRMVCSNGLVVGRESASFRHRHVGFDQEKFIGSVKSIAHQGSQIAECVDDFKQIEMSPDEQGVFARAASELITDEPDSMYYTDLLRRWRYDDRKPTLWHTFNRIQENVMKGGIRRIGKKKTRKITSIDKDIKLNKALWVLTEKMAELKN